ncbi:M1 family aminopeptidase [Fulvivirgaceae bacterium BMA10]|uniref:M1 family aminopeptidase n=1 Tax=Splendidivirga corallicola TaxID=3051826 RepID=A0ABT8KJC4_9BACT|nr:M1 family aminopeptidase [Fulvivirgaceae bacterium BMA10]
MLGSIFLFEIRYRFRRPVTYVYFVLLVLIGLLYGSAMGGAFNAEIAGILTGGGKNLANSPYNLHFIMSFLWIFYVFLVAAIMGVPVYRDFEHGTHALFFTKPISKLDYLGGRFLGSFFVALIILSGLAIGTLISSWMPYVDQEKYGPFNLYHYIKPYLISIVPFSFFCGSIFFATVSISRNQIFIYLNAIIIIILLFLAQTLFNEIDNKTIASLLDPSGNTAFTHETEYWTVFDRNSRTVPFTGTILINILIYFSISVTVLLLAYRQFSMSHIGGLSNVRGFRITPSKTIVSTVTFRTITTLSVFRDLSLRNHIRMLFSLARKEAWSIISSIVFIVIVIFGLFLLIVTLSKQGRIFGTPTFPVTYQMLEILTGNFEIFILIIIGLYAGELVWKERRFNVHLMLDAMPVPNWLAYGSKLMAMFIIIFLLMGLIMLVGLITQSVQGYFRYELWLYIRTLFGYRVIDFLLFAIIAFLVQIVVNNKFLGYFLMIILFLAPNTLLPWIGLEHKLFRFGSDVGLYYSDMNGYGHFPLGFISFKLYWSALGLLMIVASKSFWMRGAEMEWVNRMKKASQNFSKNSFILFCVALTLLLGSGGFIYYNTNILNEYTTGEELRRLQADYEKKYKKYEYAPKPKITAVNLNIELYPEKRSFSAQGTFILKNKTSLELDSIHLDINNTLDIKNVSFNKSFELLVSDEPLGYYIYKLNEPLLPSDSIELTFEVSLEKKGFSHDNFETALVYNGTFLNSFYFPKIGYQPYGELIDDDVRKEENLGPKLRMAPINDTIAVKNNFLTNDADWIDFEAIVGTSQDQIAIVPGYLQKEWRENDRRYFHYKMDSKMLNFYNVISAKFEVLRDEWKSDDGRKVNLEIYYHKGHEYNLERMMDAMKKSLTYFNDYFGPYQHHQLRILEFPRYASFAQSFANTVPFSEGIGFIANVDEEDIDYPFYVTAHEVAHQWWGHQVIGGNVQGSHFLSETMSQYAAMMVMVNEFGEDQIKKYLRHEMNEYLTKRSGERKMEMPVLLSENQSYIHYNKGSVLMYALKDYIGEERLNKALKGYIESVRFQEPPYTTANEWLRYIDQVTPDSLKETVHNLLGSIVIYENKFADVSFEERDNRFLVKLKLDAKKYQVDGFGEEHEIPLNDYIDIGIFSRKKMDGKWQDSVLYFKKHKIVSSNQEIEIWVEEEPDKAGIDPYYKLIDKKSEDNTKSF